jgi:hypothetical protein
VTARWREIAQYLAHLLGGDIGRIEDPAHGLSGVKLRMGANQQRRVVAAQPLIKAVLAKENLMKARDFSFRWK